MLFLLEERTTVINKDFRRNVQLNFGYIKYARA